MVFSVKTEQFQGPFDLLLDLIEKRKLFINEISLAKVTDDFVAYLETKENFPLGESAQFILVAATLLLIKSRSLLPNLELTQEEQTDIKSLETRLRIYKRIREASGGLSERFGEKLLFPTRNRNFIESVFTPGSLSKSSLEVAIKSLVNQIPKIEKLPQVLVKKVISLEEMIERLATRVESNLKLSFKDFAGGNKSEKINVIVSFLAMLELVKRGAIHVEQQGTFDEINIETKEVGIPKYE